MIAPTIRSATIDDASIVLGFITELAVCERAEHEVLATLADLERTLFGPDPAAHALIASIDGEPVGMAVWFYNYSTWLARRGVYLEDLYVTPAHRGSGVGRALLSHLARIAIDNDCPRFEWSVLDWNAPAIKAYEAVGASPKDEWVGYRLSGDALAALAGGNGCAR